MATNTVAAEVIGTGVLLDGTNVYIVTSQTEAGRSHIVRQEPSRLSCDCKGFTYRGKCAHIAAVTAHKARLQLEAAELAPITVAEEMADEARERDLAIMRRDTAILRRSQRPFSLLA